MLRHGYSKHDPDVTKRAAPERSRSIPDCSSSQRTPLMGCTQSAPRSVKMAAAVKSAV